MHIKKCLILLFSCLFMCLPASYLSANTGASFLKIGVGARAIGMGSAYTAIGDDVNAIHWNPAGISQMSQQSFSATHTGWITDINYDFAGYVYPGKLGIFGGSIICLSQGELEGRDENRNLTQSFSASDIALTISFARQTIINDHRIGYGINLKAINQQIETEKAFGVVVDLGLLFKVKQALPLQFGLSIQNLGPQMKFINEGYDLPLSVTAGVGYAISGLTIALDIKQQVYEGRTDISIGTEYFLVPNFAIRAGYLKTVSKSEIEQVGMGIDGKLSTPEGLGAGFGLKIFGISTDYSFTPYGDLGSSHRISFGAKF